MNKNQIYYPNETVLDLGWGKFYKQFPAQPGTQIFGFSGVDLVGIDEKNSYNDRYHGFRKTDDVMEFMSTQQFFDSPFRGISRTFRAYFIFYLTILNSEPTIV